MWISNEHTTPLTKPVPRSGLIRVDKSPNRRPDWTGKTLCSLTDGTITLFSVLITLSSGGGASVWPSLDLGLSIENQISSNSECETLMGVKMLLHMNDQLAESFRLAYRVARRGSGPCPLIEQRGRGLG
jgi:hypothetical protein